MTTAAVLLLGVVVLVAGVRVLNRLTDAMVAELVANGGRRGPTPWVVWGVGVALLAAGVMLLGASVGLSTWGRL